MGHYHHIYLWKWQLNCSPLCNLAILVLTQEYLGRVKCRSPGHQRPWFWLYKILICLYSVNIWNVSYSTQEWMFLWKCQSFWDRKCLDLRGTRASNLRIHAECSSHWRNKGQTLATPCCWLWYNCYCCSKINIWNVNCTRATTFIFESRTDVLRKCRSF